MVIKKLRNNYHKAVCEKLLTVDKNGVPNNADKHSTISVNLAKGIIQEMNLIVVEKIKGSGQTAGKSFGKI